MPQQRGKRRSRGLDDIGHGRRLSAGLEEPFPQVNEMTLDLRLAGPAQIAWRDDDAVERVGAEDALVRADDLAVFQRERVEGGVKLRF